MSKSTQSVYRTARGTHIDMLKLINQNEMTIAVGNMNVNARGDKLGQGGKVIQKREEVVQPAIQNQVAGRHVEQPVVAEVTKPTPQKNKKSVEDMDPEGNE